MEVVNLATPDLESAVTPLLSVTHSNSNSTGKTRKCHILEMTSPPRESRTQRKGIRSSSSRTSWTRTSRLDPKAATCQTKTYQTWIKWVRIISAPQPKANSTQSINTIRQIMEATMAAPTLGMGHQCAWRTSSASITLVQPEIPRGNSICETAQYIAISKYQNFIWAHFWFL